MANVNDGTYKLHLTVLLNKEEGGWFAQGLELDYAACGETLEEVQYNFINGLSLTVGEYIKMHGSIEKFLKPAPTEVWESYYKTVNSKAELIALKEKQNKDDDIFANLKKSLPFWDVAFLNPFSQQELCG